MPRPFTSKTTTQKLRDKLETQLTDLADQTDGLRKQVVEQVVEQAGELRQQVADRAPVVREQIVSALPDKDQLLVLRDDLFEKLPDTVQDKLPERAKPRRTRLRKVAAIGVLTGAGAAAFAILKRRGGADHAYTPPTSTPPPAPAPTAATAPPAPASPAGAPTAAEVVDATGADTSTAAADKS